MVEATTSASSDSTGTGKSASSRPNVCAYAFEQSFLSPKVKRKTFLEDEIKMDEEEKVGGAAAF